MQMVVFRRGRWPVDLRCASLGSKAGRTGNAGLGLAGSWLGRLGGEFTCLQAVHARYSAAVGRLVVAVVAKGHQLQRAPHPVPAPHPLRRRARGAIECLRHHCNGKSIIVHDFISKLNLKEMKKKKTGYNLAKVKMFGNF